LVVTIVAALITRSYWALIGGFIAERLVWVVATYVAHPYRPRVSWAAARELWDFSRWIPVQNTGRLLRNNVDSFLVGRLFGAGPMGIYTMAGSAAGLAVVEIVGPVSDALLPSYAQLTNEPERLGRAYIDALAMIAMVVIASQVGMAAIAPTFFPVVLGQRWVAAIPTAQWLALYSCLNTLSASVANVLVAQGRMGRLSGIIYFQLALYAPALLLAAQSRDLVALAMAKSAIALLVAPILFASLIAVSSVTAGQILRVLWRPICASVPMAGVVRGLALPWSSPSVAGLVVQIAGGVATFGVCVGVLWLLAGRPNGAERTIVEWVTRRAGRRQLRSQRVRGYDGRAR